MNDSVFRRMRTSAHNCTWIHWAMLTPLICQERITSWLFSTIWFMDEIQWRIHWSKKHISRISKIGRSREKTQFWEKGLRNLGTVIYCLLKNFRKFSIFCANLMFDHFIHQTDELKSTHILFSLQFNKMLPGQETEIICISTYF